MPPKSAAERMRIYRQRLSPSKLEEIRKRNRIQQQKSRAKWNETRRKIESFQSTERKRMSRQAKKAAATIVNSTSNNSYPYASEERLDDAVQKTENECVVSDDKKLEVVKNLTQEFDSMDEKGIKDKEKSK